MNVDKVVYSIFSFLAVFTIVCLIIFIIVGSEPSTLISCVFGACVGELSILGYLHGNKRKYNNKEPYLKGYADHIKNTEKEKGEEQNNDLHD
ncbi:hypothetical protein SDC9_75299 [bioreactor metagenome]|uniref:Uncharacterized protein n=1 Tax=bioreactor metagenome TaxID=1076179 RepID=A0A644YLM2_9ZZZZ|nr:hypothetical protein [Oscillospiraceae bacterium]